MKEPITCRVCQSPLLNASNKLEQPICDECFATGKAIPMAKPCPEAVGHPYGAGFIHAWDNAAWIPGKAIAVRTQFKDGVETVLDTRIAWPVEWGVPPYTCGFCGGIRPEDLVRLIGEGWELENTNKNYKWYLHRPGWNKAIDDWRRQLACAGDLESPKTEKGEPFMDPIPCVKVYNYHLDKETVLRVNHMLKTRPS